MSHIATPTNSDCSGISTPERHHESPYTARHQASGPRETSRDQSTDRLELHPRRRSSAFVETGLEGEDAVVDAKLRRDSRPKLQVRFRSKVDVHEPEVVNWQPEPYENVEEMPAYFPTLPRLIFLLFCAALILPSLGNSPLLKNGITPIGAKAGPVGVRTPSEPRTLPEKRQDTEVCKRWSGQSAVVNGTFYYYGGRTLSSSTQTADTWSEHSFSTLPHSC